MMRTPSGGESTAPAIARMTPPWAIDCAKFCGAARHFDSEPARQELRDQVAADVACTARNEDVVSHA